MASRPRSNLTVEQYLAAYEGAAGRYELVDGEVLKMAAESNRHSLIKGNIYFALRQAVTKAKANCTVVPDGATIRINSTTAREPDVSVQCGEMPDLTSLLLASPALVVEVISPSTEGTDANRKLLEYFSVPSIMHYLIVWPKQKYCFHHRRIDDNKVLTTIVRSGLMEFDPPGVSIDFESIFDGVDR